jgi:hypothetical protein
MTIPKIWDEDGNEISDEEPGTYLKYNVVKHYREMKNYMMVSVLMRLIED